MMGVPWWVIAPGLKLWQLTAMVTPWPSYRIRIGLIGCHPEAEQFWYDSYSWMRRHWSGGHRHKLLEFADQLMRS
jgi:hypothetical protein